MAAPRSKLKALDPDQIRGAIQSLVAQLPSAGPVVSGEVLPPISAPPSSTTTPRPQTADDFATEIAQLWSTAQETFLDIGRLLDDAQRMLPPDGYVRLCGALPFGKSARSQLLSAYRLIGARVLPDGVERAGYAAIYLCATLTEREREQAIREGVIGPSMQKHDIVAFRRRIRSKTDLNDFNAAKRAELGRLRAERDRLDARIRALAAELGEG